MREHQIRIISAGNMACRLNNSLILLYVQPCNGLRSSYLYRISTCNILHRLVRLNSRKLERDVLPSALILQGWVSGDTLALLERTSVRLVGVDHRADTLTSTQLHGQRCVTWAWRTSPSGLRSQLVLAGDPSQPVIRAHALV